MSFSTLPIVTFCFIAILYILCKETNSLENEMAKMRERLTVLEVKMSFLEKDNKVHRKAQENK